MQRSSASFLASWKALRLPAAEQGYTAVRVEGTNAWIYKTPQATFGLLLAGVSPPTGFPALRHIHVDYKAERVVRTGGSDSRLTRCLEVQVDSGCDQATLARVLERLTHDEPTGGFTSELFVKTVKDAVELVRPAVGEIPFESVVGVWGELYIVNQLVTQATSIRQQRQIVSSWESQRGTRDILDFRFDQARVALEVKTSLGKRVHHFNGPGQVNVPGNMDVGYVASLLVRESEAHTGRTCADLIDATLAVARGNQADQEMLRRILDEKIELRGQECRDDRYPLVAAPGGLVLFRMQDVPKPPETPNVTDVEWTSDLTPLAGQLWEPVLNLILKS